VSYELAIDCGQLESHAQKIDRIADSLDDSIGAITYMTIGSDAYGLMCAMAAMPTNAMGIGAGASLVATRAILHRAADIVRSISQDFATCEQEHIDSIRIMQDELDGVVQV
jgi:hypothetical protein